MATPTDDNPVQIITIYQCIYKPVQIITSKYRLQPLHRHQPPFAEYFPFLPSIDSKTPMPIIRYMGCYRDQCYFQTLTHPLPPLHDPRYRRIDNFRQRSWQR